MRINLGASDINVLRGWDVISLMFSCFSFFADFYHEVIASFQDHIKEAHG